MPQYVVLSIHTPDICPSSNAKSRKAAMDMIGQMGSLMGKHKVKLVSSHVLSPSHKAVFVVDAPNAEAVRDFLMDAGIVQWNETEVYTSWPIEEAMKRANAMNPIAW